jgi:hypothetical protein
VYRNPVLCTNPMVHTNQLRLKRVQQRNDVISIKVIVGSSKKFQIWNSRAIYVISSQVRSGVKEVGR